MGNISNFGKKLGALKLQSERDNVHSQNSFQTSQYSKQFNDIHKDSKMTIDSRSLKNQSRPWFDLKHPNAVTLMTTRLLDIYK